MKRRVQRGERLLRADDERRPRVRAGHAATARLLRGLRAGRQLRATDGHLPALPAQLQQVRLSCDFNLNQNFNLSFQVRGVPDHLGAD